MGRAFGTYEAEIRCIQKLGGKIEGKETTWEPRRRRESNIKMGLEATGWTGAWNGLI
jgi:hypothetical protein